MTWRLSTFCQFIKTSVNNSKGNIIFISMIYIIEQSDGRSVGYKERIRVTKIADCGIGCV